MPDPRLSKLAKILVHYSLDLKAGNQIEIRTNPLAQELALLVYEEAIKIGAHVYNSISFPGSEKIFFDFASGDQLDFVSPVRKLIYESFDAILAIGAEFNTRSLSGSDPKSLARARKASTPLTKILMDRAANLDLR